MSIQLNGINCFYGAHQALFDITLDCPQGETLVLLGPSGAGKSSLLRVLNLLEMPRSVRLTLREITSISARRRQIKQFASCVRTSEWSFSNTIFGRTSPCNRI